MGAVLALGAYGFVATFQSDPNFGRVLAAYGGVFVAGSLAWGMVMDGFRPDRWDVAGALVCLAGVGLIMYARARHVRGVRRYESERRPRTLCCTRPPDTFGSFARARADSTSR